MYFHYKIREFLITTTVAMNRMELSFEKRRIGGKARRLTLLPSIHHNFYYCKSRNILFQFQFSSVKRRDKQVFYMIVNKELGKVCDELLRQRRKTKLNVIKPKYNYDEPPLELCISKICEFI